MAFMLIFFLFPFPFSFCFILRMDTWSMLGTILPLDYIAGVSLVYFEIVSLSLLRLTVEKK